MKLVEVVQNVITVTVDQAFSDATFDFDVLDEFETIKDVPEQLKPLVQVITPTDNDYRGTNPDLDYQGTPELAFYVGIESGKVYQRDLLNDSGEAAMQLNMNEQQFMQFLQKHIVQDTNRGMAN